MIHPNDIRLQYIALTVFINAANDNFENMRLREVMRLHREEWRKRRADAQSA